MYPRLKDRIVLITGASTGIGASTARLFGSCGSNLILTARRVEKLDELKKSILEQNHGISIHTAALDVRDPKSVDAMITSIPASLANVDVLVNNAGLALGVKHTYDNDLDQMNTMIDTNVKGVFYMIKAVVPGMMQRGKGDIVNISSVAGLEGYPGGSAYCASKFAVQALTESLRKEVVATPLRVTSIAPGLCGNTEFSLVRLQDNEAAKKVYQGITALDPDDVADNIAYVVSRPSHVQISQLTVMPTNQAAPTVVHRETK
eukprot:TRINITY_DN158_c0_g1_i1.p1 TRINITY_DN158_c0_g1~~TRINITY_DN158_c0_g1_i1.p1  ORF type:complete len:261 (-),score=55.71 TRINITY_DN158_c0_g1_i1:29-811(-)